MQGNRYLASLTPLAEQPSTPSSHTPWKKPGKALRPGTPDSHPECSNLVVRARPGIDTSKACRVAAMAAMAENHNGEEGQGDGEAALVLEGRTGRARKEAQ